MNRRWPSRKLQIGTMVVLAIGAAIQVFMPPMTRYGKARGLYLDGWFGSSVPKLEKALALLPGDSLTEQALVWRYPKDKLPDLLKNRHLGLDAQRLAAGRIYQNQIARTEDPRRQLSLVDDLIEADPTNALPHYRKAFILQDMGRLDAALLEVRRANALGKMSFYSPVVDDAIRGSSLSPAMSLDFSDYARLRRVAMPMADLAHVRLREGAVEEAAGILEDCCRMSVVVSTAEPPTIIGVLVGKAVYMIAWTPLEPIYKDFGMRDRLAGMKRLDSAYERTSKACRQEISFTSLQRIAMAVAIPFAVVWAAGSAAVFLLFFLLWWMLPAIRRRGQSTVSLNAWGEGWIARVSLIVTVPLMAAAVFLGSHYLGFDTSTDYMGPFALLIVLAQIIVVSLGLRVLHHRHDENTGEKTGVLRFIFKTPAAVKAWTRKSLMIMFAGQIAFAACLALLAINLYKPIFGGYPWQPDRFTLCSTWHEEATMRRVGDDLRKACFSR